MENIFIPPGVDLNKVVDGIRTVGDAWQYYTINVKYLGSMTHEQFEKEYPEATAELKRIHELIERWEKVIKLVEDSPDLLPK